MVKNFLKQNGVDFEEIDVTEDAAKAAEMVRKSGQSGVPVTEIDGQIVVGYDLKKLRALLKL
jgi:glutaredoxin